VQAPTGSRLLRATAGRARGSLALLVCAVAVRAVAALAVPTLLADAVDAVLRHHDATRTAAVLACVLAVDAAGEATSGMLAASCSARSGVWLRMLVVRHVLALGPRGRTDRGEAVTQLTQAAPQAAALPVTLSQWAVSVVSSAAAFVLLWLIDWRVGLAFAVAVPLAVVLARRFVGGAADAQGRYLGAQARIASRLIAALGGARTIRASGTLRAEAERVLEPLTDVSEAGHTMWRLQRNVVWQFGLLLPLTEVLVLAVAGTEVAGGRLSPGQLLAVTGYLAIAAGAVEQIDTLFVVAQARAGAARICATLAQEPPGEGRATAAPGGGRVTFRGVTVHRDGAAVLDGVDLELRAGECLGLVGRSGAGKSVLAGLLGRLTDPDGGEVLLDGVPVSGLPLAELRRHVTYAFERPVLAGATVHEAIGYGLTDPARDTIVRAARAAHADRFVRRLPDGYDTPLDRAPMSGGERQRLGLARALARQASVYVLDDATSGLDTVTEAEVSRAVTGLLAGRTRLVVAHRPTTAARCDRVAWLDGGRIRALAPHSDLWHDPAYRAAFTADGSAPTPGAAPAAGPVREEEPCPAVS
jgi:ATP-binding cassette, subfamily B, bacterial